MRLCPRRRPMYARGPKTDTGVAYPAAPRAQGASLSNHDGPRREDRLQHIRRRLVEARRELDALIGDAYLRPRANIVPVHFLDLAAAVEKLRWAEREWQDLDREAAAEAPARAEEVADTSSVQRAAVGPGESLEHPDANGREGALVEVGRSEGSR